MCEEFGSLPTYFVDYLRLRRGVQTDSLRIDIIGRLDGPESQRKQRLTSGTPAEQYSAILELIKSSVSAGDRLRYINMAMDNAAVMMENRQVDVYTRSMYSR